MKRKLGSTEDFLYPLPCVLVSCGLHAPNIITVAWCGVVCSDPPLISVSIRPQRFSHDIIRDDGVFGINLPKTKHAREVDLCGNISGRNADKFKLCNFTMFRGENTGVPLIAECPVNIECEVFKQLELGVHTMFIGKVVEVYVDSELDPTSFKDMDPLGYLPFSGEYIGLGKVVGKYGFSHGGKE